MDKSYNVINEFLNNPQNTDSFYESDTVIAIDWREYDEDIVQYFNHAIGYKISVQMENNDKPYGNDIILTYKEKTVKIPYEEKKDRDTTIIWINEVIKEDFSICLFTESMEDDTLLFCVLPNEQWNKLEKEQGKTKLNRYFSKITLNSKMFSLQYDVVEYLRLKKMNPDAAFFTLVSYLEMKKREQVLTEKKNKGEIGLKEYLQGKKEIKAEEEKSEVILLTKRTHQ